MVAGQYHSNMANVTEISQFDAGIYQLETTDVVEGGALGVDNYQAKGLANRTRWLYNQLPAKKGWVTGINPGTGTIGDTFTCSGDIASCVLNARQFQANRYLVTMTSPALSGMNYKVSIDSESMSSDANWINDTNFREPLFKKISTTQFYLIVDEDTSGFVQNIKIHFEVKYI